MVRSRLVIAAAICIGFGLPDHLLAQRIYSGGTTTDPSDSARGVYSDYGRYGQVASPPMAYPPRTVYFDGIYPSRTILNQATRGSVIEYTHNGNGYISTPGSSYQTVISSGPPIFPTTTIVQPAEPPITIEAMPISRMARSTNGTNNRSRLPGADRGLGTVQLLLPTSDGVPFSYVLNGTRYSIKSGYVHAFADDRDWIIEFASDGYRRPLTRYRLRAGTYQFARDANGWDLKMLPVAVQTDIPPRPPLIEKPVAAPAPSPGL